MCCLRAPTIQCHRLRSRGLSWEQFRLPLCWRAQQTRRWIVGRGVWCDMPTEYLSFHHQEQRRHGGFREPSVRPMPSCDLPLGAISPIHGSMSHLPKLFRHRYQRPILYHRIMCLFMQCRVLLFRRSMPTMHPKELRHRLLHAGMCPDD